MQATVFFGGSGAAEVTVVATCTTPPPTVSNVSPDSGTKDGGTSVTITGTNFGNGTTVTFGGAAATGIAIASSTELTAITPSGSLGEVDVEVTTSSGADTLSNGYTYTAPTIVPSPPTGALTSGQAGVAYNLNLTAAGGATPHSFTVSNGSLPAGLTLASNGTLSGTPTVVGNFSFTVAAKDAENFEGEAVYTIAVSPPVIAIAPASLPNGTLGSSYGQTITASGGTASYRYAMSTGSLPDGVTLSTSGTLSGTPTENGTFNFSVVATDSTTGSGAPYSEERTYALTINNIAPATNPVSVTVAANSANNSVTLNITGGAATSIAVDSDPANGTTSVSGTAITYTPTPGFSGSDSFTYTATNDAGTSTPATVSITVTAPTLFIAPGALANGAVGASYSQSITASGGFGPYEFTVTDGTLPAGLTLASDGNLTGMPTAAGTFNFEVTVEDSSTGTGPFSATQVYSLTIGGPTIVLSPTTIPDAARDEAYSQTLTASGGTGSYNYAVTNGALPAGVSLLPAGSLTGIPTEAGTFGFTVTVTDSSTGSGPFTGSQAYSLVVMDLVPVANPVAVTVAANSTNNSVTLNITGGAATSIAVDSDPANGTTSVSGTAITYTPTPGFSGPDSFTYTATNATGISAPATVSITVTAPTLTFTPAAGPLPSGTVRVSYSQTVAASQGAFPYNYAVTTGSLPPGLDLLPNGTITGTPTTEGSYSFTITATDANDATGSVAYTIAVIAPLVANPVSVTVAANSANNPVTLNITGGAATSIAVDSDPANGTTSVSGTAITYTPTPGFSGSDSFTYTATNNAGTSTPATVSITVTAPTLVFAPATGTLPSGRIGTAYTETVAASRGASPYNYAVTTGSLPPGLDLLPNGMITGTPTADGSYSFTITATDAHNATGSVAYTIAIIAPPIANPVSETVAANSTNNPVTLNITGGAATSIAVDSNPANGTAVVSGTAITYTPTPGFSGSDSFTYTATNATGISAPATVSIIVTSPTFTFTPVGGPLPSGTVRTGYSQTVAALRGAFPYSYAVTTGALPPGLDLLPNGMITGTPTTDGSYNFTITATDANNAIGSVAYSIAIIAPPTFSFTPASGTLDGGMAGEEYSQQVSASGGSAPYIYSVASGRLPDGMVLNVTTGELSGTLDATSEGNYTFEIQARDANGNVGDAQYTMTVGPRNVTVDDKVVNVPAGATPNNVNLAAGATGGPFVAADITFVEPANAGTLSIVNGEFAQAGGPTPSGWYLKFTPNPAYSGTVRVGFRLTSALGQSNIGVVTYSIGYNQSEVKDDINELVQDFVRTRQSMISSSLKVPGLLERRRMENANSPVTTRMTPSERGMTFGFSTSLAQLEASRDAAGGSGSVGQYSSPFNIWIDGTFLMHNRSENDERWGSFGLVSAGADYLMSDRALIGLSIHYDRMTDPTDEDAELTGNGWLLGPYASFEFGSGVFWDTSLLYGGSSNTIDTMFWDGSFDTTRWMVDTALKGSWDLGGETTFTPKLRAVYFYETVDTYSVTNDADDVLAIDGFSVEQFRVSLGAEVSRNFILENETMLTPKLGLTGGFAGMDGSGAYGNIVAGVSLETVDEWSLDFSLLLNIEGDGDKSAGAKANVSKRF